MPHDRDGNVLQAGDFVQVPCVIESVQVSEEFCNVTLKTETPMPPYTEPSTITINTKQVVKVHK